MKTDYQAVLADLLARRAKLDQAISAIQEFAGASAPISHKAGKGEYRGLTIAAATIKFLQKAGEPQLTADIAKALKAGGLGSNAKSLYRTVYNTLVARMKNQKDIAKSGSKWTVPAEK